MKELNNIVTAGSDKTPDINFNYLNGELRFSGWSIPENANKVYEPLLNWVIEYIKSPQKTTNLHLNLEYYNSASTIWFAKIVRTLSKITKKDSVLIIHIYVEYKDFDSLEMDDLSDIVGALVGKIENAKISIGIKVCGLDRQGKIVKDAMIFI